MSQSEVYAGAGLLAIGAAAGLAIYWLIVAFMINRSIQNIHLCGFVETDGTYTVEALKLRKGEKFVKDRFGGSYRVDWPRSLQTSWPLNQPKFLRQRVRLTFFYRNDSNPISLDQERDLTAENYVTAMAVHDALNTKMMNVMTRMASNPNQLGKQGIALLILVGIAVLGITVTGVMGYQNNKRTNEHLATIGTQLQDVHSSLTAPSVITVAPTPAPR